MQPKAVRAAQILAEEGVYSLFERTKDHVRSPLRERYYRIKLDVLNGRTVTCRGVVLPLQFDTISREIRDRIIGERYEVQERELIKSHLHREYDVVELGAGVGFISVILDEHTSDAAKQISIEANPRLVPVLEATRRLNGSDFEIVNLAYTSEAESVELYLHSDVWESSTRLPSRESVRVDSTSLSELLANHDVERFQLIADIEGSEYELIENELDVLESRCESMIMEFHEGSTDRDECIGRLSEAGFECLESRGDVYAFRNASRSAT